MIDEKPSKPSGLQYLVVLVLVAGAMFYWYRLRPASLREAMEFECLQQAVAFGDGFLTGRRLVRNPDGGYVDSYGKISNFDEAELEIKQTEVYLHCIEIAEESVRTEAK